MACGCTENCTCLVVGINGVTVTGDGSVGSPYSISPPAAAAVLDTVTTVFVDTTIDDTYSVIWVDSTAAPVTITLPLVPTNGKRFTVKDYGATGSGFTTTNAVAVDPNGANIDGIAGPLIIPFDSDSFTLITNGTDWAQI